MSDELGKSLEELVENFLKPDKIKDKKTSNKLKEYIDTVIDEAITEEFRKFGYERKPE